jgi:hypothetical protein
MKLNRFRNLKVGIFISGQLRQVDRLPEIIGKLKKEAPFAKIIGAHWDSCFKKHGSQADALKLKIHVLPEPEITYKPYTRNKHQYEKYYGFLQKILRGKSDKDPDPLGLPTGENDQRPKNQTKMILIHNEMIKRYQNDFDVVARIRWDHRMGDDLNLYELFEEAYTFPSVVSLCNRPTFQIGLNNRFLSFDSHFSAPGNNGLPHARENQQVVLSATDLPMVNDYGLIIHRPADWDCDLVDDLHNKKMLLPAEWGWYQCLIELPNNRLRHWDGGISILR